MLPRVHPALLAAVGASLALSMLAGCTTQLRSSSVVPATSAWSFPPAARVLVSTFAADPDAVRQDQGIGARLERQEADADPATARAAIAADVQSAMAEGIIRALDADGIAAVPAAQAQARPGDLLVLGGIDRIDEGNRTRRLVIGFGAGRSVVTARASLYAVVPGGPPDLLRTFEGRSDSGRKPGLAIGAAGSAGDAGPALGAASATLGVTGEARRAPVAREAGKIGDAIGQEIAAYAAEHGWRPARPVNAASAS